MTKMSIVLIILVSNVATMKKTQDDKLHPSSRSKEKKHLPSKLHSS
jgi:hypothetical protein